MSKHLRLSLLAAVAIAAVSPANAATVLYSGQDINNGPGSAVASNPNADAASASFLSALSGTSTESFETFATGASAPLNLSFTGSAGTLGATLTGSGVVASATRAFPSSSGQYAVGGSNFYSVEGGDFGIVFDQNIAAFGFFATDLEDLANIDIILNYAAGGSMTYNLESVFGPPAGTFLESGSVHFLGFIDTANPFMSVDFAGVGAAGDILAFDLMTIGDVGQVTNPPGAVPEPSTWALMLLGFFGIGAVMRRRKDVTTTVTYA
jgi:hypothetical protein